MSSIHSKTKILVYCLPYGGTQAENRQRSASHVAAGQKAAAERRGQTTHTSMH